MVYVSIWLWFTLSSSARGTPRSCLDSRTNDASMHNVWATVGFSNWETRGGPFGMLPEVCKSSFGWQPQRLFTCSKILLFVISTLLMLSRWLGVDVLDRTSYRRTTCIKYRGKNSTITCCMHFIHGSAWVSCFHLLYFIYSYFLLSKKLIIK